MTEEHMPNFIFGPFLAKIEHHLRHSTTFSEKKDKLDRGSAFFPDCRATRNFLRALFSKKDHAENYV